MQVAHGGRVGRRLEVGMTDNTAVHVTIQVADREVGLQELDDLASSLRRELLELDVEAVTAATSGPAPPGTRGTELAAVGELLVTVARPEVLAAVVTAIGGWISGRRRSVTVEIDGDVLVVTGVSAGQQERLIDDWLRRQEKV